ncbi:helix-turn-helix domain-containing protein [Klebsiella aerogenes]
MTDRELYRLGIIQRVFDRALLQRDAADILELSVRQVQRLVRLYRTDGASAFASSRRGRPANNRGRCRPASGCSCGRITTEYILSPVPIAFCRANCSDWLTSGSLSVA